MTDSLPFRNLEDPAEKEQFIHSVRKVRRNVLQTAQSVPPDQWYTPRYHDWSVAGMLGHLHLIDTLAKRMIQASMIGIAPPLPLGIINRFNDLLAPMLKTRNLEKTQQSILDNEAPIIAFIQEISPSKFDKRIYSVLHGGYITLEQGVQLYYLFHWHGHYQTMRQVDGIFYQPPTQTVV